MTFTLTPSQTEALNAVQEAIRDNERLFILWYGGVRAGKSFGAVNALIEHCLSREYSQYIVGGYVMRSVVNNIIPYFKQILDDKGVDYKVIQGGANPRIEVGTNTILLFGGDNYLRAKGLQGLTAAGLLLDEFENLDYDFVKQAEARISAAGALRIYTSNKGQPYSWAKREYYDRAVAGEISAMLIDTEPIENTFVKQDYWDEKREDFTGVTAKRFLENDFALPFTPLYNPYTIYTEQVNEHAFSVIYSLGNTHYELPVDVNKDGEFIMCELAELPIVPNEMCKMLIGDTYLVNAEAARLGRELINGGKNVRGYFTDGRGRTEMCQRAFASGKVKVWEAATRTMEAIHRYHTIGFIEDTLIIPIEAAVEYLARTHRWI